MASQVYITIFLFIYESFPAVRESSGKYRYNSASNYL